MNRNQKIALGCGGAGCLGLIVLAIAGSLIYLFTRPPSHRTYNVNVSTNRNSNLASNANDNSSSSSTSVSSMSEDDKHKLYQAATMTGDTELLRRVEVKLGLMENDYTQGPTYQTFVVEHVSWSINNRNFIASLDTPDKARDYVNENFPD